MKLSRVRDLSSLHLTPVVLVVLIALASTAYAEEDIPSVTPYRPTVSNPAQLSRPGWLEIEGGWLRTVERDGAGRNSTPYTLKLAFTEDIGILVGGDAYVAMNDANGNQLSGLGDTLLLIKQRWGIDGNSALGIEYGFKAATAKTGVGSGKSDYLINGIYSTNVGQHAYDLNLSMTQLGAVQDNNPKQQMGWATTWSHPAGADWVVAAELSGTARQGVESTNQLLLAASYVMNPRVVWDTGFAKGISSVSPSWSVFCGVSVLAGKVF
jgi:hypothetical protein